MSTTVAAPASPFKGLAPFEDSDLDALLFFGREVESEVIAANLMAARLTILYGPSGVGKSSVLRAGVAYRLRNEQDAEVVVFSTWTGDPVAALIAELDGHGDSLVDALADAADRAGGDLYVILDQFEELFLYHRRGGAFAEQLAQVLRRPGLRVNVLLGMREDALARLDALKASIPNLLANRLRLERLDRAAGTAAIVGPITRYNELVPADERVAIEPELEEAILDEVTAGRVDLGIAGRGTTVVGDENRIEAPYLQLVLARLWEVERDRGSRTLRLATLRELGGAERIVEDHLEHAMAELSPREKGAAAAMYNFLVTPSGTKIAHGVRDLAGYAAVDEDEASEVLRRLTAERIVRASSENGPSTTRYEIFHDVLADAVLAWRTRFESERALIEERERHHRRQRRLVAIGAAALLGLAIMAAVAVYALAQRSNAQHQAAVAKAQTQKAVRATKVARKQTQKAVRATKVARKQTHKANAATRRAERNAALFQAQKHEALEQKALAEGNAAEAERQRRLAELATGRAQAQTRVATRAKNKAINAERRATRQRNIVRAQQLEAEARARLTEDAEQSVRRSLAAVRAYRTAGLPQSVVVEDTLREGIQRLRLRAVLDLPGGGAAHVAAFSPDDSVVFVGGQGGARLYDVAHRYAARTLLPRATIVAAAFSPDGALVAGAAGGRKDRVARVWDVRTGALVLTLEHQAPVNAVAFSPDGRIIATGSDDGTARLWSVATGGELASFAHQPGRVGARGDDVQDVSFSPDGKQLLTVGGNRFARVFSVQRQLEEFSLNNVAVVNVARFSHDGSLIATAGAIEAVRLWDAKTGLPVRLIELSGRVADLAFSPNDELLATAGSNDTVARILSLTRETPGSTITVHRSGVETVVFTPNGQSVVTAGRDGRAVLSGIGSGIEQALLAGHTRALEGAAVSHDGALVATSSQDGTARIWNARVGVVARDIGKHDLPPTARRGPEVAFSPSGRIIASGGADGTARLWRGRTELHVLRHDGPVNSVSFSRNGRVITAGDDGTARLWRVSDGVLLALLPHGAAVTGARVTPTARFAISAGRDGLVRVWNVATKRTARIYEIGGVINDLELSRDGRFAVAASSNGLAAVVGVTARSVVLLKGHTGEVVAATFSADGRRVATASEDWTARIWDPRTGKSVELIGHRGALSALAFNPTESLLATTGADTDVRVWNGRSGREVAVLRGHSGGVNDVTFSADGRWIASAGPLSAGIWQVRRTGKWRDTPLFFVNGDAARTPRLDRVAFSPSGWRLLTGWRLGNVRVFDCTVCGNIPRLEAIAKSRLNEIVRRSQPASKR